MYDPARTKQMSRISSESADHFRELNISLFLAIEASSTSLRANLIIIARGWSGGAMVRGKLGKIDFPYHFKKIIVRYKKIGYNINVMRQTACLVVNPIKVNSFAYLFNCTTVGRTSD